MVGIVILAMLLQQDGVQQNVKRSVVVPGGTVIPVRLTNKITTKNAKSGDSVYGKTLSAISVANTIVIPEGSDVQGKLTAVRRSGRVKGRAELTLSFQSLMLPNGTTVQIYTSLRGVGGAGERKGEATVQAEGTKGRDAATIGIGTAAGVLIGGARGRDSLDRAVGGIVGGLSGAVFGVGTVLLTRGNELALEPGTTIEVVLDRDLEF
jgi:type IV secretion system protein VirB10